MKKGVLILGHGSRRQAANEGLKQLDSDGAGEPWDAGCTRLFSICTAIA
ncbi:MAG: hypothetical protein RQM95_04845 [Syntrophaceticus schinkii]